MRGAVAMSVAAYYRRCEGKLRQNGGEHVVVKGRKRPMLKTYSVVLLALAMSIGVAQAKHVIPGCAVGQPARRPLITRTKTFHAVDYQSDANHLALCARGAVAEQSRSFR
jgi:hypothetical protein